MKVALFDFCETLTNFQTAEYYVMFALKKTSRYRYYERALSINWLENLIKRNWKLRKKILLFFLCGVSKEELVEIAKEYYNTYIKPNSFNCMRSLIFQYKRKGYQTYIISGGYSIYIDIYAKECGMDGVVANDFKYKEKNGKYVFTGKLVNKDCMEEEKINRIESLFQDMDIDDSIAFSDSYSDLPLLKWADKGVVVSKYKRRKFAEKEGFDQIVISEIGNEKMELTEK